MALRKPNPAFEDTTNLDQEQVQEQGAETVMNTDTQAANDTATWEAGAPIGGDDLRCTLRVERFAPQP